MLGNTCGELPWLPQLRKAFGKEDLRLYIPVDMSIWSPAPVLDPVLPGFWCRYKEGRAEDVEQGNVKTKI